MKKLLPLILSLLFLCFGVFAQTPEVAIAPEPFEKAKIQLEGLNASDVQKVYWYSNKKTRYNKFPKDTNFFRFKQNGKWGLADEKGKILIPAEYDRLNSFTAIKDGKYGSIDIENNVIFPFEYDKIEDFNRYGFAKAEKNGLFGILYYTGEIRIPLEYAQIEKLDDSLHKVQLSDGSKKWGMYTVAKRKCLDPIYDDIQMQRGRFFVVKQDGLYGVKTALGNPVLPIEYKLVSALGGSYILIVGEDDKGGLFHEKHGMVIPMEYEELHIANWDKPLQEPIRFKKGTKYGKFIFNKENNTFTEQ